jgi:CBS domain-containing protein
MPGEPGSQFEINAGDQIMQVQEIMTTAVECCTPNDTAQRAAEIMRDADTGVVPVLASENEPKVIGIVTDRDLCMAVIASARDARQVCVQECMTGKVVMVRPEDEVDQVADLMAEKQVRRLPVVNEAGAILGIVSLADLAQGPQQAAEVGETVHDISEPTPEPSMPRAESKSR